MIDREDPAVLINNLGQGVMTFTILVTNSAPTATLTAMATVNLPSEKKFVICKGLQDLK